jgi:hypothetical protein
VSLRGGDKRARDRHRRRSLARLVRHLLYLRRRRVPARPHEFARTSMPGRWIHGTPYSFHSRRAIVPDGSGPPSPVVTRAAVKASDRQRSIGDLYRGR